MMSILDVRHVSKSFQRGWIHPVKREVLHDISFSVEENEILGLAGASGAGKTTLIRIIMQLLKPDTGEVILDGENLSAVRGGEWKEVHRTMQLVFQNPASSLNPRMTIQKSMEEPLHLYGEKTNISFILEKMQLREELLTRYPHQLSGGELQRVCLARLLLLKPRLLLLDEPTSMLDVSVQAQIISILKDIRKERPMACLFISHDLDLLHAICDRIGILQEGRLIELADTETLYKYPKEQYTKDLLRAFEEF